MNTLFFIAIALLLVSGFFDAVPWRFNIFAIVFTIIFWLVSAYNQFVRLANRVKEAWSDIEVQMKRRYDLIPNFVETVKGYAAHEKEVFEGVTKARSAAMGATDIKGRAQAENMLSGALKSLFAVSEAYPQLRANENFIELQRELSDTENKIQAARRFYNGNVRDYNTLIESFPSNILGKTFAFTAKEFFELDAFDAVAAHKPVEVKF